MDIYIYEIITAMLDSCNPLDGKSKRPLLNVVAKKVWLCFQWLGLGSFRFPNLVKDKAHSTDFLFGKNEYTYVY